jgi:hypothetical protein
VAGEFSSSSICFMSLFMVVACCVFHLSNGISCIPRYMYGSFWYRTGIGWFLYFMLCDWMNALKVVTGIGL